MDHQLSLFGSAGKAFANALKSNSLSHAMIISGSSEVAVNFAKAAAMFIAGLSCPDEFSPNVINMQSLKMQDIRELLSDISKQTLGGKNRVVIIDAYSAQLGARQQNALLKTIEEPPANTYFLLLGDSSLFLPTVLSRCTHFRLDSSSDELQYQECLPAAYELLGSDTADALALQQELTNRPEKFIACLFEICDAMLSEKTHAKESSDQNIKRLTKRFTLSSINDIIYLLIEVNKRRQSNQASSTLADFLAARLNQILNYQTAN